MTAAGFPTALAAALVAAAAVLALLLLQWLLGVRYIPHHKIGVVERLWSLAGSLSEGRIIARDEEAGFQAAILRGGIHLFYFPWQYRIHLQPLVVVPEGKIAYVYARDGQPLPPTQTLGRTVDCNHFQDAQAFLIHSQFLNQKFASRGLDAPGLNLPSQASRPTKEDRS